MRHFHLVFALLVRMPKPGYCRGEGYRCGHAEICYHLAVVAKFKRNHRIEYAENNSQHLTYRIALCVKHKRSDADKRRNKGEIIPLPRKHKRHRNQNKRPEPYCPFVLFECLKRILIVFHAVPQKNKHPPSRLLRPNDEIRMLHYPVAIYLLVLRYYISRHEICQEPIG